MSSSYDFKKDQILNKRRKEIESQLKETKQNNECYNDSVSNPVNKFSSDGSFMDQFKTTNSASQGNGSAQAVSSDTAATTYPEVAPSASQQQNWFQDALRRAREKAREMGAQSAPSDAASAESGAGPKRKWAEGQPGTPTVVPPSPTVNMQQQNNFVMPSAVMNMTQGQHMEAISGIMITKLSRNNPAIIAYAHRVFGSTDLTDAQWKQCEEQMKMNIVFQILQEKKKEAARLEQQGKVKYEYDSDEDTEGGTWEHKRRKKEMTTTASKAEELTRKAEGKHHIGDFLPPEELLKFMEKYQALKTGRDPDLSDYSDKRLTEDNVGYRMLKMMGWTEGTGLGSGGQGIKAPVNQKPSSEKEGVGANVANDVKADDDEYDAYRKRMMLAYRFRPNPMNNPRRSYY